MVTEVIEEHNGIELRKLTTINGIIWWQVISGASVSMTNSEWIARRKYACME